MDNKPFVLGMSTMQHDFTSIRILLQVSISEKEFVYREYISNIVRDAKLILQSPSNITTIDRDLFEYSVFLRDRGGDWINQLNPDNLKEEDIKKMLEVFKMP